MKKQSFLLVAGALMALASCQNNATDTGADQAQIDSAVNARVEELRMQMMMQNDSLINAEAQRRADSMIAAMNSAAGTKRPSAPTKNTGSSTSTSSSNTGKTVESGGLRSQSDQNRSSNTNTVEGGGLRSQSDQNRVKDNKAVEKGGLRSQSDQNRTK